MDADIAKPCANNEIFPLGSHINCVSLSDQQIDGEVLAFDRTHNLLALKSIAGASKGELFFVNINMVKQVQQTKPPPDDYRPTMPDYNEGKIKERHQKSKAEKRRTMILCEDVTTEGEAMFKYLSRRFEPKDVQWLESTIMVLGCVAVRPPYAADDAKLRHDCEMDLASHTDSLNYVKNMILKHADTLQKQSSLTRSSTESPTPVVVADASNSTSSSTPTHAKKRNSNASSTTSAANHNNATGKH